MDKANNKLILYELNEVPLKLLNFYTTLKPNSNFNYLINSGKLKPTITNDIGELHPWSTWPTVHRGVNNNIHNIRFINQDLKCAKAWPPIWETISNNKISIGIFGSLQSYPPIINKNVKFFLPDTFSPKEDCFPESLNDFQKFNLKIAGKNKALAKNFDLADAINFIKLIFKRQINFKTFLKILKHLFGEFISKKNTLRRSLIQPIIGFDIYLKYINKFNPQFSTFFTNHVAGMMHRYWIDIFPISRIKENKRSKFNKNSIIKSLDIADKQIGKLINLANKKNYNLLILSSMGQDYKDWGEYVPELFIDDISKLIENIGLNQKDYKILPAMQPDLCIKCKNKSSKKEFIKSVNKVKSLDGKILFPIRYSNEGLNLNISIQKSIITANEKYVLINNSKIHIDKLNIKIIKRDEGTGYHIKEGILLHYGEEISKHIEKYKDSEVDTTFIHDIILDFFDLKIHK
mgnify:FL=1